MKILECDLGNTRCKWRIVDGERVLKRGLADIADNFSGICPEHEISRARVSSVAVDSALSHLLARLKQLGLSPQVARSQLEAEGISNAYGDQYNKLGVDRWLAIVASYKQVAGAVLVLDAGSALTADLVDHDGRHLGGYIAPGVRLMKSSLLGETGGVRFDEDAQISGVEFGVETKSAVMAGIMASQIGACGVAIEQAKRRIAGEFAILVTGGLGAALMEHLPQGARFESDLVLDGLRWVVP